jgi:DNA polymerase-3 subunit gamma/tau
LWPLFLDKVHSERPLVSGWIELGTLLSTDDRTVKIGLPITESAARENLLRPATKKFLEGILSELLARNVAVEVVLDASLQPPPATEMSFGFAESESPAPSQPAENAAPPKAEIKVESKAAEKAADGPPPDFYNDPLIQAALTKFKATLVTP